MGLVSSRQQHLKGRRVVRCAGRPAVKLMKRSGLGGSRIPAHNVDHAMLQQKEEAINAALARRKDQLGGGC
jgi:hypothetical protein